MNRKIQIIVCVIATFLLSLFLIVKYTHSKKDVVYTLYIGGYGNNAAQCRFNATTLDYTIIRHFGAVNPSYLTLSPTGSHLYGVSENGERSGVFGYSNLPPYSSLGMEKDWGAQGCHLIYHRNTIITANYGRGGIYLYPTDENGKILPASQKIDFYQPVADTLDVEITADTVGLTPAAPLSRIHMLKVVQGRESGREYLLATDTNDDKIRVFNIVDAENGRGITIQPCNTAYYELPDDYGPRNMELSADGRFLYVLCEKSGRIVVYTLSESNSNLLLTPLQNTLSDQYNSHASADIHIEPSGKYLYASHRKKHDGISIYSVDKEGVIIRKAFQVTGRYPRSFAISPNGELMFVACQKDEVIQIFRINKTNGLLTNTGKSIPLNGLEPSCVIILPNSLPQ